MQSENGVDMDSLSYALLTQSNFNLIPVVHVNVACVTDACLWTLAFWFDLQLSARTEEVNATMLSLWPLVLNSIRKIMMKKCSLTIFDNKNYAYMIYIFITS